MEALHANDAFLPTETTARMMLSAAAARRKNFLGKARSEVAASAVTIALEEITADKPAVLLIKTLSPPLNSSILYERITI